MVEAEVLTKDFKKVSVTILPKAAKLRFIIFMQKTREGVLVEHEENGYAYSQATSSCLHSHSKHRHEQSMTRLANSSQVEEAQPFKLLDQ